LADNIYKNFKTKEPRTMLFFMMDHLIYITVQKFGVRKIKKKFLSLMFTKGAFTVFYQKYSKITNIMKYYWRLK